jgi:hypothetical protein
MKRKLLGLIFIVSEDFSLSFTSHQGGRNAFSKSNNARKRVKNLSHPTKLIMH